MAAAMTVAAVATNPAAVMPAVPTTRVVRSLDAGIRSVLRAGGRVTSETRTVAGIGSWAFVADGDGREIVLWEAAATS